MMDDMNTPRATAGYFGIVTATEKALKKNDLSSITAKQVLDAIKRLDTVFGVLYTVPTAYFGEGASSSSSEEKIPLIQKLCLQKCSIWQMPALKRNRRRIGLELTSCGRVSSSWVYH